MRIAIAILLVISFLTGCEKRPIISLNNYDQNKIIALQPFGDFNNQQLAFIRNSISTLFHTPVLILKPIDIPVTYRAIGEEQYSSDSLIMFLSKLTNDKILEVIGLTHKDIYTMREYKIYEKNVPHILTEQRNIFGFGYVSGNSCIISDYRLLSKDRELLNFRLRKVIIHEIGHNLGLPHCSTDSCIMSAANGDIGTLDKCAGNYCNKCRRILN